MTYMVTLLVALLRYIEGRTGYREAMSEEVILHPNFVESTDVLMVCGNSGETPSATWGLQCRNLYPRLASERHRFWITRIDMAHDAHARVIRQYTFDARGHFHGSIGHRDLSSMLRVPNSHAAAIVDRHPRGAAGRIH